MTDGIPGTGCVDWDGIFKALSEMNYQGYAAFIRGMQKKYRLM